MDIETTTGGDPYIALLNADTDEVRYVYCDTSPCTNDANWTWDVAYDSISKVGAFSKIEFTSTDYPKIVAGDSPSTWDDIIYLQQQDEPEPPQVPELPQNNMWKVLIALLALGLVVCVVAVFKKKKK